MTSGWPLFVTATSVSLLTSATVFVLGLIVSAAKLAIFASAERITRAALRASAPVGAVTFPRVSFFVSGGEDRKVQRLAVLTLRARAGLGLITAVVLIALAPLVVELLLGPGLEASTETLRILAVLIPLFAISATLSQHWLLAHGRDATTLRVATSGGVLTLLLTVAMGLTVGIVGVAWALVAVQAGVAASLAYIIRRTGIAPRLADLRRR